MQAHANFAAFQSLVNSALQICFWLK